MLATLLAALLTTGDSPLPLARSESGVEDEGGWGMEVRRAQKDHMDWWREAKFGMFIHWGLYAVPAGEWEGKQIPGIGEWILNSAKIKVEDYEPLQKQFNPVKFSAKDWVDIAKSAGMKYIVITSKHHDGFGLWDSAVTDWDVMNTPYGRDLLKQLADECAKQGIRLCFYHSIMDWHHPDYSVRRAWDPRPEHGRPNMDRYVRYMKAQLKELLSGKYGDIGIAWFDGEWESAWNHARGVDLYNFVRSLDKDIIINNRVDKGRAGMAGMTRDDFMGDYGTPEQEIPATGLPGVDWESCMTMNNTWGFKKNDHNWKSTEQLLFNLVDVVSKGGNYLLNVGPTAEGLIPGPSIKRLKEMGGYVRVNADALYGAGPSPFEKLPYRVTTKPGKLYVHVFRAIDGQMLELPGLQNEITNAYALNNPSKTLVVGKDAPGDTRYRANFPDLERQVAKISLVGIKPNKILTTICVEIEGDPIVITPPLRQASSGLTTLSVTDAKLHGGIRLEEKGGEPNVGFWYSTDDWLEWTLEVHTDGPHRLTAEIAAPDDSKGSTFELRVGNQAFTRNVETTGDWAEFKTVSIGTCNLRKGTNTIQVRAKNIEGPALMNLRSVTLTRARGRT